MLKIFIIEVKFIYIKVLNRAQKFFWESKFKITKAFM